MAGCRMIQDGIENIFYRPPRKEISQFQRGRQGPEDLIDWTRLTLSLQCAIHEIEVCVRYLEPQLFEPSGSRQYDISKTPGGLVHEQVNADDQFCLVEPVGNVSGVGERRQHV